VAVPFIPESDQPIQAKLATVKTLFDAGAALFLDARDPEEYDAGHIPGALRLTRQDALSEPDRMKTLPVRGRPIVAYCAGGVCEASRDLAEVLVEAGYRKVLVYAGGFPEWAAAGYPVERGSGGP
jgi:rhodanese-related sulfurtransferase